MQEQYIYQYNTTVIKAMIYQFEVHIALLEVPDLIYCMKLYSIWSTGLTDCQTLIKMKKYTGITVIHIMPCPSLSQNWLKATEMFKPIPNTVLQNDVIEIL